MCLEHFSHEFGVGCIECHSKRAREDLRLERRQLEFEIPRCARNDRLRKSAIRSHEKRSKMKKARGDSFAGFDGLDGAALAGGGAGGDFDVLAEVVEEAEEPLEGVTR